MPAVRDDARAARRGTGRGPREAGAPRLSGTGLALMLLFTLWSGVLGAGFGVAVVVARDRLGEGRSLLFALIAIFMLLAAVRTAYELLRRLRGR